MDKQQRLSEFLQLSPVIPVLVLEHPDSALAVARALVAGGMQVLEVTLRTPAALEIITRLTRELPNAIIAAGTVTRAEQLLAATRAGAHFAVSPGLTPQLALAAQDSAIPLLPGVASTSEAMLAMDYGFRFQKLFPAEAIGGISLLKFLVGPLPELRFCPTGGIRPTTAASYLALDNVICVGGSWLVNQSMINQQQWSAIELLARQASALNSRQ